MHLKIAIGFSQMFNSGAKLQAISVKQLEIFQQYWNWGALEKGRSLVPVLDYMINRDTPTLQILPLRQKYLNAKVYMKSKNGLTLSTKPLFLMTINICI